MRRTLLVLAAVLGGLLLVVGVAVAVVFGPDDTADTPASPLPDGVRAATTVPDLLGYRDATLRVTAESAGGPVFVGAGNPIDVDSYLGDTRQLRVTTVTPLDGATGTVRGTAPAPAVAASSLDLWDRSVHGRGAQALTLDLDGTPTSVAVLAAGKRAAVTVSFGLVVAHAFVAGLAAAVLGLVLLTLPVLARRRRRRRERAAERSAAAPEVTAPEAVPAGTHLRSTRRPLRWAVPVLCVVALAGCTAVPQRVTTAEITRPGLERDELTAALASYDERNNAAIDLASRTHDASGWATADRGIILRSDLHSTRYAEESGEAEAAGTALTTTPDASSLVSPSFTGYPMWFAVTGTMADADEKKPERALLVFERDGVLDPWRMSASVEIGDEKVRALAPGAASRPSPAQVAAAQAVSDQVVAYLETGEKGELTVPDRLARLREEIVGDGVNSRLERATIRAVGSGDDALDPGEGAPKVAAVEGGVLVTATFSVDHTQAAVGGDATLAFTDEAFARAVGQTGRHRALELREVLAVAVLVPDDGTPTFLGVRTDTVGPPTR
ncbi:hypothetical protein ACT17Q_11080 [Cellulomonas sp. CW35]|uniref:hypothetical protein n=1 Tax=Cellulomonas sp. CW35 TaxID=3458249 RepID=UPI004033B3C7